MTVLMQLSAPFLTFSFAASSCPARQPTMPALPQFIAPKIAIAVVRSGTERFPTDTGRSAASSGWWFFQYPGLRASDLAASLVFVIVHVALPPPGRFTSHPEYVTL